MISSSEPLLTALRWLAGRLLALERKNIIMWREEKAELFPFDPNTADSTQLLRLGLSE